MWVVVGGGWVYQAKTNTALVQLLDGGLPELVNCLETKPHLLKNNLYTVIYRIIFHDLSNREKKWRPFVIINARVL